MAFKLDKLNINFNNEIPSKNEFLIYYAFKNRTAFPEIFIKEKGKAITLRYYQIPPTCTKDAVWVGGRATGKSHNLESHLVQNLVSEPHKETLFSTLSQIHLDPRMDKVYTKMKQDEILSQLLCNPGRKQGSPYLIISKIPHAVKGIIVGLNKKGDNILGSHVDEKIIDESQNYPTEGYNKSKQATAESLEPVPERMYGVPDNRVDTPFSNAIGSPDKPVYITPSYMNPFYTKQMDEDFADQYKGRKSAEYRSNVLAEESEVSGGAWDWSDIFACIKRDSRGNLIPAKVFEYDKNDIEKFTTGDTIDFVNLLKHIPTVEGEVFVGNDVGQVRDPSIIIPFIKVEENGIKKWKPFCRIILRNMKYITQAGIIDYLMGLWGVSRWCVDATGSDGKALIENLNIPQYKGKQYEERIVGVNFREGLPVSIERDKEGNVQYGSDGKPKFINADTKAVVSNILFNMFRDKEFILANDHQLGVEFTSEIRRKKGEFNYTYFSTNETHTIDAFRCFAFLIHEYYHINKIIIDNQSQKFTSSIIDVNW